MKILIINIVVLFLIIQSATSRNIYILFNTDVESIERANPLNPDNSRILTDTLIVGYGGGAIINYGIAKLDWAFETTPINAFQISRKIANNIWTIIDNNVSILPPSYLDIIPDGYCGVRIEYKIDALDASGSIMATSNIAGKDFTESRQPEKPILDSVSINSNDNIVIGWDSVTSPDVMGIIIYRKVGSSWPNSITIPYSTHYEDTTQFPCINKNIVYAIASVDSCGNKSPKTELTAQRPIFLEDLEFNLCSKTISLLWEPYINALSPFNKYEIWSSKDGSIFTIIDTVASSTHYYNHTNVENGTNYRYFVRAVFGPLRFTSTSCTKSITTGSFTVPDSLYLANASVLLDNSIELTIDVDLKPHTCTWEIMRSEAEGELQTLLTTLSRDDITTSPHTYIDTTANGSTGYYNYSVNVYDSCETLSLESNTLKTIFLTGEQLSITENKLTWNTFKRYNGSVDKYYIFRILGDVIPVIPIDSVTAYDTTYIDDISLIDQGESKFSYWVQAVEGDNNVYGYQEKSNSNIISFFKEINFYFPNAFRPDSDKDENRIFKPASIGFGGSNYTFQIYNRWGQLIFESTDYEVGWDGTYKGNPAPQGTYIYRLSYQNVFDETKQQKGSVMLID